MESWKICLHQQGRLAGLWFTNPYLHHGASTRHFGNVAHDVFGCHSFTCSTLSTVNTHTHISITKHTLITKHTHTHHTHQNLSYKSAPLFASVLQLLHKYIMQQKYFSNLGSLGCGHLGLLFTNAEQKKVDS